MNMNLTSIGKKACLNSFREKAGHRVGNRCFNCLETDRNKCYQQTNDTHRCKHPPADMDSIGKIL